MTDEQIKQAVDQYIGYPREVDEGLATSMRRDAFKDGARWRIESVWHEASEIPENGKLVLGCTLEGDVYMLGPNHTDFKDTSYCFGVTRWAYVSDLLPQTTNEDAEEKKD